MKRLILGSPLGTSQEAFNRWAAEAFQQIERATAEDIETVLSEYSTTGTVTELRTFNAATATASDLRNVLATLIQDIKKRGQKRSL